MNKYNIKTWVDGDLMFAEWADRAPDDDDRYASDGIVIVVSAGIGENTEKRLMTEMSSALDRWYKETRR